MKMNVFLCLWWVRLEGGIFAADKLGGVWYT